MNTVIVSGARTPFGKLGGALAGVTAVELGAVALREALLRGGVAPEEVEEVVMGMVLQGGAGQIPSRQALRLAGMPWAVRTETINKVCASGLRSITLVDQMVRAGDLDVALAGGMESMSNAPYFVRGARFGLKMGDASFVDLMQHDGLTCAFDHVPMVVHGSTVAEEYHVSREAQDAWAYRSHARAVEAMDQGKFAEEITPVSVSVKAGTVKVDTDEAPRRDTSLERLAALRPVGDLNGTVTAGNAPGVNDGAAALLLMSEARARREGREILGTLRGHAEVALEAKYIASAPGVAVAKLLEKTGRSLDDIALFEINEAFAAVPLVSRHHVPWDLERVNVNGGAVALGHPIGASGARILLTLLYELRRRGGGLGVAAICSGAAQGDAVLVEV